MREEASWLAPGARLGPYVLEALVGEGGFGAVWRARDTRLGRAVAIKVLKGPKPSPDAARRFEREIESASRVRHPNLVAVHAAGEERGLRYLVTDFVPGETLAERVRKGGPAPPRRVAEIGKKLALALDALHRARVVHRDVKPANVIVDEEGEPRLTDFGIAKLDGAQELTRTHEVLGTPTYAPLEQLEGKEIDGRADIYALGATLHELAAGAPPYAKTDLVALIAEKTRPARPATGGAEPALDAVILRCLGREPLERFAAASDVAQALAAVLDGAAPGAEPAARRAARVAATAGAIFAGSVSLFVTFLMVRPGAGPEGARALAVEVAARRSRAPSLRALDLADVASRLAALDAGEGASRAGEETRAWVGLAALARGDAATASACAAPLASSSRPVALALKGGLALLRDADPRRASQDLERAALAGLDLPELEVWRLRAALGRSPRPGDVAAEVVEKLGALRARFDPGREGDELELACLVALRRGPEARAKLEALADAAPELRWAVALLAVDHELARPDPPDALAALGALERPPGPLGEDDRRRLAVLRTLLEKELGALELGVHVPARQAEVIAAALALHARLAPGEPLSKPLRDRLDALIGNPSVSGIKELELAAAELLPAEDDLLYRIMLRAGAVSDPYTAAGVESVARRIVQGGAPLARRLEARIYLARALLAERFAPASLDETTEGCAALAAARAEGTLERSVADELEAQLLFARAAATRNLGHPDDALRLLDKARALAPLPPDALAHERMLTLEALGRMRDALDAGLAFFEEPPVTGAGRKPVLELAWKLALRTGRVSELGPAFSAIDGWRLDVEPVWEVRRALVHAARIEWARAAAALEGARAAPAVAARIPRELVAKLGRGDDAALAEVREAERELSGHASRR